MAVFNGLRLVSLAVLMLASQLDSASAAVRVYSLYARGLSGDAAGNPPDPYLKVWCGSTFGGQTEYIKDNANPTWSPEFNFPNCKSGDNLKLEVWDKDLNYDDLLGTCTKAVKSGPISDYCNLSKGSVYFSYEVK